MRALVFDSGVGGLSVLDAMVAAPLPLALDYVADTAWLPYGDKPAAALRARVQALLAAMAAETHPDIVVVACNTASTLALDAVRARLSVPVVGVVPPIKPASELTKTGVIGLLATPATASGAYADDLIARFAANARVIRHGSTALVAAAEAKLAGRAPDPAAFVDAIAHLFAAPGGDRLDVVALACTHFPLVREDLAMAAPRPIAWLDSGAAIARRVAQLLELGPGAARCERVYATDLARAAATAAAFAARGFAPARLAPEPVT